MRPNIPSSQYSNKQELKPLIGYESEESYSEHEKEKEKEPALSSESEEYEEEKEKEKEREDTSLTDSQLEEITQICPITHEIMRDPVVASDGHTYEHAAIAQWQASKGTSPLTKELISDQFKPNIALKKQIEETHRLAIEKEKALEAKRKTEKEKEKIKKEKEKKEKKLQEAKKGRKQDQETFQMEMRKFMEEQQAVNAALAQKIAQQDERINGWEERLEDLNHRNSNLAKDVIQLRNHQLFLDSILQATPGAASGFVAGTVITVIVCGVLIATGTIATGGLIWVVVGVGGLAGGIIGGVIGTKIQDDRDELSYARDKPLFTAAIKNALNGKFQALGDINFKLSGLKEACIYVYTAIGNGISYIIDSWRKTNTLSAPQQVQYLEDVKSNDPKDPAVKAEPVHIQVKHAYDKGLMRPVSSDNPQLQTMYDVIVTEGNKKLQEGNAREQNLKASAIYTLCTTAVDVGITAVKTNTPLNFDQVCITAIKIDNGFASQIKEKPRSNNTSTDTGIFKA